MNFRIALLTAVKIEKQKIVLAIIDHLLTDSFTSPTGTNALFIYSHYQLNTNYKVRKTKT